MNTYFYDELEKISASVKSFLSALNQFGLKGKQQFAKDRQLLQTATPSVLKKRQAEIESMNQKSPFFKVFMGDRFPKMDDFKVRPFSEIEIGGKTQYAPPNIVVGTSPDISMGVTFSNTKSKNLRDIAAKRNRMADALAEDQMKTITNIADRLPFISTKDKERGLEEIKDFITGNQREMGVRPPKKMSQVSDLQMAKMSPREAKAYTGQIQVNPRSLALASPLMGFRPPVTKSERDALTAYVLRHEMDERRLLKRGGKTLFASHVSPVILINDHNFLASMIKDTAAQDMGGVNYLKKIVSETRAAEYRAFQPLLKKALEAHLPPSIDTRRDDMIDDIVKLFDPAQRIEDVGRKKVPAWAKRALQKYIAMNPDKIPAKLGRGNTTFEKMKRGILSPIRN